MKYDPIKELNRETERRFWWPIIAPFVMTLAAFLGVILCYVKWPEIDAYCSSHPYAISAIFSGLALFGLWRLFKIIAW